VPIDNLPPRRHYVRTIRRQHRRRFASQPTVPSTSLREASPDFAHTLAKMYPRNHWQYFALPLARRHLAQVILSEFTPENRPGLRTLADALETMSASRLIELYVPTAPPHLARILTRLDDGPWKKQDYQRLRDLLATDDAAPEILRHLRPIIPAHLETLKAIPSVFRSIGLVQIATRAGIAQPLAETLQALLASAWVDRAILAERLRRVSDPQRILVALRLTLDAEPLEVDFSLDPRFERPATILDLARLSVALKNCMAGTTYKEQLRKGTHVYLKWTGIETAAVEVFRDNPSGWRMGLVAGVGNTGLSPPAWRQLATALMHLGVRIAGPHPQTCFATLEAALNRYLRFEDRDDDFP
jgi:hypothetical protein